MNKDNLVRTDSLQPVEAAGESICTMSKFQKLKENIKKLKKMPIYLFSDEENWSQEGHPFFGLTNEEAKNILANILNVKADDDFNDNEYILKLDGQNCFSKGNIGVIKAHAKQGKTQAVAVIACAALKGELWRFKSVRANCKVVIFDTEQATKDTHKLYMRILQIAECTEEDVEERFAVLSLRSLTPAQRWNIIQYVVSQRKPDIVLIDGYVDLVENFNDQSESSKMVNNLMRLSNVNNCFIMGVIHTNPSEAEGKARGHLGTILEQKSSDVLQLTNSNGVFTVSTKMSREQPLPTWKFRFNDDGLLESADDVPVSKEDKCLSNVKIITDLLNKAGGTMLLSELKDKMMEIQKVKDSAAYDRIKAVKDRFLAGKNDQGKETLSLRPIEDNKKSKIFFLYSNWKKLKATL